MNYIVKPIKNTTLAYCYACSEQIFNDCKTQSPKPSCSDYTCGKLNS